jgi:hypothetical protein
VRLAAEAEVRRRGWRPASSPGETGLLLICGEPGAALDEAIETVWWAMPGPRAQVRVDAAAASAEIAEALDRAVIGLADVAAQRVAAGTRPAMGGWSPPARHEEHHMGAPAGLAMADRAADRDGLTLDVLRVPLGPVLADWPAGLQVVMTLQGDVVQGAEVEVVGTGEGVAFWDEPWLAAREGRTVTSGAAARRLAAAHLDSVGRLLGVAGWPSAAARAGRLRDDVLAGRPAARLTASYGAFARRIGRSRLLRWMIRDFGVIDDAVVDRFDLTGPAARHPGDVAARLAGWLAETTAAIAAVDDETALAGDEGPRGPVTRAPSAGLIAALPALLEGAEFSAARLIIASLDPDVDQLVAAAVSPEAPDA